ncbi:MAG: hypothetical protein AAF430_10895 [Myxococcota bacterium]
MNASIVAIEPATPLDPYRPFTVRFRIVNDSETTYTIPDLRRVQLAIAGPDGTTHQTRTLDHPLTIEQRAKARRNKGRDDPEPLALDAGGIHEGEFETLDAFRPLPSGPCSARLLLPDGTASEPVPFAVAALEQRTVDAIEHPASGAPRTQQLVLVDSPTPRLVFVSSLYPEFPSVIAELASRDRPAEARLLHYWPPQKLRHRVASVEAGKLRVLEVADPPPYTAAQELARVDELSFPADAALVGLIDVTQNEAGTVANDYLVLSVENGGRALAGRYLRRDWEQWTFGAATVLERAHEEGFPGARLSYTETGLEVRFDAGEPIPVDLRAHLGEFRAQAAADPAPTPIAVGRGN